MNKINAVALDIDGVLTDGTFIWGLNGEEFKSFSFLDIMGISLGSKAGLIFALISGENNLLIDRLAEKMHIVDIYKECKDKAEALILFGKKYGLNLDEICFMGDDVNDIGAMEIAGLSAAPANAHKSVKQKAALITEKSGGQGAVRELLDIILTHNKKCDKK
ncbi:MAG TPA: HAD hydrolase family protein [Smithella sp.]|nr:HAD hydrolase family protein [Smithella sp.]